MHLAELDWHLKSAVLQITATSASTSGCLGNMETDALDPCGWGWILTDNGTLKPVATEDPVAPEELLKYVRCKCKMSSAKPCNTNSCSCKKNGLSCVQACGDCRGEGCHNSEKVG